MVRVEFGRERPMLLELQALAQAPLNWAFECKGDKVVARTEDDWDCFDKTRGGL